MGPISGNYTCEYLGIYPAFSAGAAIGVGLAGSVMLNHTSNRWFR
jgi:hypothetical protein